MTTTSTIPGDKQTLQAVAEWVRTHVTTGTVMISRSRFDESFELSLIEVDMMNTAAAYLFAPGLGTFEVDGTRALPDHHDTRLLIPLPDVALWAIGNDLWTPHGRVPFKRPVNPRSGAMRLKLLEQSKSPS